MSRNKLRPLLKAVADLPDDQTGLVLDVVKQLLEDDDGKFRMALMYACTDVRRARSEEILHSARYYEPESIFFPSEKDLHAFSFAPYVSDTAAGKFIRKLIEYCIAIIPEYACTRFSFRRIELLKEPESLVKLEACLKWDNGRIFSFELARILIASLILLQPRGIMLSGAVGQLATDGRKHRFVFMQGHAGFYCVVRWDTEKKTWSITIEDFTEKVDLQDQFFVML